MVTDDIRTTYSTLTDLIYWNTRYYEAKLAIWYIHDTASWYHTGNVPYFNTLFFPYHTVHTHHTTYSVFPIYDTTNISYVPYRVCSRLYSKPCTAVIPYTNILYNTVYTYKKSKLSKLKMLSTTTNISRNIRMVTPLYSVVASRPTRGAPSAHLSVTTGHSTHRAPDEGWFVPWRPPQLRPSPNLCGMGVAA